jgi:hypothetical protein
VRTAAGKAPVMPVMVKRGEKLVIVPPVVATDIILRKLVSELAWCFEDTFRKVAVDSTYYAFLGELAPSPSGIVPSALFPFANVPRSVMGYS